MIKNYHIVINFVEKIFFCKNIFINFVPCFSWY